MKKNTEIDTSKVAKDIGVLKYGYLNLIQDTIDSKNRVNLDYIKISDSNKRSLEAYFKRKGFLAKLKLKGDSKKVLYLNPFYAHTGKTINKELYDAFNEINKNKVY